MESSFPLQDGQINKLRILSEVYSPKKWAAKKKQDQSPWQSTYLKEQNPSLRFISVPQKVIAKNCFLFKHVNT